jgi:hypothetical protein
LAAVARVASRLDVRWFLFGAQAVALYGVPRTTADVDVTLLCDKKIEIILEALRQSGIEPLIEDDAFIERSRVIPAEHPASGWRLDVVLGGTALEEQIAADVRMMEVGKTTVPVVRLEHLLVLKVLAHRPQDMADVARLIDVRGDVIRFDEVTELLSALEEGLGEEGLLNTFEQLRASTNPADRRERPDGPVARPRKTRKPRGRGTR